MKRILGQVTQINRVVSEMAVSAQEQATSLAGVNSAINEMDRVTQQNAAMVEQSTAASHSLANDTTELERLTGRFKTGAADASATPPPHRRAQAGPALAKRVNAAA